MKDATVASRYAKALLLLIQRHQAAGAAQIEQLDRTLDDLRGLAELVRPGSRIGDLLSHPKVRPEDKRSMLRHALDGRVERTVVVFADLLLRKKRLVMAHEIAREFTILVDRVKGVQHAQVVSAVPLTPDELARLHTSLEKRTGQKITVTTAIDPTLVGGAYARIGDRIIDRSVHTLLQAIANRLYEVSV
jgi:F-type H+-transporting ATPase subunit delta